MSKVQLSDLFDPSKSVRYRLLNLTRRIYIVGDYIIEAMIGGENGSSCNRCSINPYSCSRSINIIFGSKRMVLCMAVAEDIGEHVNPYLVYIKLIGMVNSSLFLNLFIRRNL